MELRLNGLAIYVSGKKAFGSDANEVEDAEDAGDAKGPTARIKHLNMLEEERGGEWREY